MSQNQHKKPDREVSTTVLLKALKMPDREVSTTVLLKALKVVDCRRHWVDSEIEMPFTV